MRYRIKGEFHAAHRLVNYKGNCSKIHGHTWKVEVVVSYNHEFTNGIGIDFKDLKGIVNEVLDLFDHKLLLAAKDPLNSPLLVEYANVYFVTENPTAENLAKEIYDAIKEVCVEELNIEKVILWETDKTAVEYEDIKESIN